MSKDVFANKYGLKELKESDGFVIDLVYATKNNFTHHKIYQIPLCLLREKTAQKLSKANAELKEHGLKIKIWDAFRPLKYQEKLWKFCPDEKFVANPKKENCNHCKGSAVDVTLCDLNNTEITMPTEFDHFGIESHRNYYKNLGQQTRNNVLLLENIMTKNGFVPNPNEWWHFEDCDNYKIITEMW